ncbi:MlaD family protein [Vibrio profundum]|uniref:PqiB family protein n=1 Tax=Vibrio profundum TaxID=2910247 RepID=UPI003D0D5B45
MKNEPDSTSASAPTIKNSRKISPLWILPVVTIVLVSWLLSESIRDSGQRIQIHFSDAQGLIAGRTTLRYHGLEVGVVQDIVLSDNLKSIYVDAKVYPEATKLLKKNTRFWLVKPTANLSGIKGLDALVSGNYIAIQPSPMPSEAETNFRALDIPPPDIHARGGLNIRLIARDLGGISVGSQILYRKIPIGEVYGYQLIDKDHGVLIQASINKEYKHIITEDSRFWNISGVGAHLGADGIDVQLTSLGALLSGAIAVDSPNGGEPAVNNQEFKLYRDIKTAGRGIPIRITLPDNNQIKPSGAPIMFRDIQIGQVTTLELSKDRNSTIAHAAIQPAFEDMLTDHTRFVLEEPQLSFSSMDNLSNLVMGNYLTIAPSSGKSAREFVAYRKGQLSLPNPDTVFIQLVADDAYGLSIGDKIRYRGISVGEVKHIELKQQQVLIKASITKQYTHLLKSKNRFYIANHTKISLADSGIAIDSPPIKQLLSTSIDFVSAGKSISHDKSKKTVSYALFGSEPLAKLALFNQKQSKDIYLYSQKLPSVSAGSPVLYRNLPVGKIVDFKLTKEGVLIHSKIDNKFRHLLTKDSVFWNASGVKIDASLSGVKVSTSSLKSLISGAIAFDQVPETKNKVGKYWKLYESLNSVKNSGSTIHLTAKQVTNLSPGTSIKYQGVEIGTVESILPNLKNGGSRIKATIYKPYDKVITRRGSYFWLASPKLGLSGVEHLANILGDEVWVEPGQGKANTQFELHSAPANFNSVTFNLQSEHRGAIKTDTPILYRGIKVGNVRNVQLGDLADRVMVTIAVESDYAYLVRKNSVFWNVSGVDFSIGLSGANIHSGTLESLINGGIAFSTPDNTVLAPQAKQGRSFYLNASIKEGWEDWRLAIPKT